MHMTRLKMEKKAKKPKLQLKVNSMISKSLNYNQK